MIRPNKQFIATICAVICLTCGTPLSAATVTELVSRFPANSTGERDKLTAEIVKLGPTAIRKIVGMLAPPGKGDDAKIRFALSGVATYVHRPGAKADRRMFSDAVIGCLGVGSHNEVKAFLIRLLQRAGKEEAVVPLSKHLTDSRLCEPATGALRAIGSPAAANALLKALPTVKKANRGTIIKALGELRCRAAVKLITKYAADPDRNTRMLALYALANIGDPASGDVLARAAKVKAIYERAKATSHYLLFARRLAEAGHKDRCANICRDLIKTRNTRAEKSVSCAALSVLVSALGDNAAADLVSAMDTENDQLYAVALQLACPRQDAGYGLRGPAAVAVLTKAAKSLKDEKRRKQVRDRLEALPKPDAEGFVPLLGGKDLSGWTGHTEGYYVKDGILVCKPSGLLLHTRSQYADFVLRFEFQLTPAANSGIGIRYAPPFQPMQDMEIQILDDTAKIYKDLKSVNRHGAVYGVVPAKHGHLKPVGQWNSQEIVAKGSRIMVTLNSTVILDTRLDRRGLHPDLMRKRGHIAILGHGTPMKFRKIRVKELTPTLSKATTGD